MKLKKREKKGPAVLQKAIQQLNDKIKDFEKLKADKLRAILLLERKKYCHFLSQWLPVAQAELECCGEGMKIKENESNWKTLVNSQQTLQIDTENLIKSQERTLVALTPGSNEYYDYSAYDNYDTSYDSSYDNSNNNGSMTSNGYQILGTCSALYNFKGEQESDLSFYEGDVINIITEDDGSGWITGELNGAVGIFPATYVKRK